jgi:hypothetical protein
VDISTFLKTNLVPNLHSHFLQHRKVSEIKWEKLNIIVKHLKKNQILYKTFFHWLINVCRQINKHVVIKDSSRHIEILKMLITTIWYKIKTWYTFNIHSCSILSEIEAYISWMLWQKSTYAQCWKCAYVTIILRGV